MLKTKGYAVYNAGEELKPFSFSRRELRPTDVEIDIKYCGVCHSDIHMAKNDWKMSLYPMVPGHEIIGKVVSVGTKVSQFHPKDLVGVGCMVDSCLQCSACKSHKEQFCEKGMILTYSSRDPHSEGEHTHGGYSQKIVVDQSFVLKVSEKLDAASSAPLLCAGITTYSPLNRWNVSRGQKVGIIGLGGLGHMAIKFASAMGAHVVMITRSPQKGSDAYRLGAQDILISTNKDKLLKQANSFDLLVNTIPVEHDITSYLPLLKREKPMVLLGATPTHMDSTPLVFGEKQIVGSLIGGIKETQSMLDFCAKHNIVADIELISIEEINSAYKRILSSDIKYRFVIDIASL